MTTDPLIATANAMVAPGKGILAADESSGTIKNRFDSIGVESTEDNRRDYRELLFTTPGASDHISGVILFDETIRQNAADGTSLVEVLTSQGIIPGIKVDKGANYSMRGMPQRLPRVSQGWRRTRLRCSLFRPNRCGHHAAYEGTAQLPRPAARQFAVRRLSRSLSRRYRYS